MQKVYIDEAINTDDLAMIQSVMEEVMYESENTNTDEYETMVL